MPRSILSLLTLAAAAALTTGCVTTAADNSSVAAGRLVAERHCAACHAIASGESPLRDAPPFAQLHNRYGAGGLVELLGKGMIQDMPRPLEEGARQLHPRMPAFPLGDDEIVALAAYLRTFEGS
jgi:cytochrome c